MNLNNDPADLFSPAALRALAEKARTDAYMARHRTLANFRLGLHNTDTNQRVWLHVTQASIDAGTSGEPCDFVLSGDQCAFDDLSRGLPFNRLIRQHRLHVQGDLRSCVQNWLAIYALTRLTPELEG